MPLFRFYSLRPWIITPGCCNSHQIGACRTVFFLSGRLRPVGAALPLGGVGWHFFVFAMTALENPCHISPLLRVTLMSGDAEPPTSVRLKEEIARLEGPDGG
jgi:hypothetical protein